MTHLVDMLNSLDNGARLTGVWVDSPSADRPISTQVLATYLVNLPDGCQGEIEQHTIVHHVPLQAGGIHGVEADGSQWLLFFQSAPISDVDPQKPFQIMNSAVERLLEFTTEWEVNQVGSWQQRELLIPYLNFGMDMEELLNWPVRDVTGGLIAELIGYPLWKLEAGRLIHCAFPEIDHDCQHDAISDIFSRWAQTGRTLN